MMQHAVSISIAPIIVAFDDRADPLHTLIIGPVSWLITMPCWLYTLLVAALPAAWFVLSFPLALGPGGWREDLHLMALAITNLFSPLWGVGGVRRAI